MKYLLFVCMLVFIVSCDSKIEEKKNPKIENIIIDNANVIVDNDALMKQYIDFNNHLITGFDIDFRTITTSDNVDIDNYANQEFSRLQEESRSKSGKAILMVINTVQDKVRLEVSMALEPIYTDAFVSYIERKGLVPYFRNDTIADAIYMAAELISDRAYDASVGKEFMSSMKSKSIGAGAKTKAHIGKTNYHEKKGADVSVSSSDTPMDVLKKYLNVNKTHNKNPNLDIYTDETKKFFANWTVTDINQDNEVRFLEPCMNSKKVKYASDDIHAVAVNEPYDKHRTCAPYFFKKEKGTWKLDINTMSKAIGFNQTMQWHFNLDKRLEGEAMYYAFALDGYTFDRYGYPHIPNSERKVPKGARWGFNSSATWYEPGPSRAEVKKHPEKYVKAMITYIFSGSYAETRLGLQGGDYIRDIEVNDKLYKNVLSDDFLRLMGEARKGSVVKLYVKNHKGKPAIRQGIAP